MDGRIAHLRNHYRIHAGHAIAPNLGLRLDRVLRERLADSYEESLQDAMRDDDAVYVLRHVSARISLVVSDRVSDNSLASNWGIHLARAVVRAIANGSSDGNLIRFENQAEYVARFLVAQLKGRGYAEWYFDGFVDLIELDSKSAVNQILLANRDHLPAILGYVHQAGELDPLIAKLDAATKQTLWSTDLAPLYDAEAGRSLFSMAIQLSDRIEARQRGQHDTEELFRQYLATAPPPVDWHDPKSLAESVLQVLRFLFLRGHLTRALWQDAKLSALVSDALSEFEWLDRAWLKAELLNLARSDETAAIDLPVRSASNRPTPRQIELLLALGKYLDQSAQSFADDDPLAEALKLFARLAADSPQLIDTAAKVMIESLLVIRSVLGQLPRRHEFLQRLKAGDVRGALSFLPADAGDGVVQACAFVARLGEQGTEVLEKLSGVCELASLTAGVASECAGVSLLLRGALDFRFGSFFPGSHQTILPHPAMLFLSVALRLGGEASVTGGVVDEGLCLISGLDEKVHLDTIAAAWPAETDHLHLQTAMFAIAAGRRLFQPDIMHVFCFETVGAFEIVAGDASGCIWPLGCVVKTKADAEPIILGWLHDWEEATSKQPAVFIDDEQIRAMFAGRQEVDVLPRTEEFQSIHDAGLETLRIAFNLLGAGKLGRPDLDLSLNIIACMLLRMWSSWLHGFSVSSIPFLLENFVRRCGRIYLVRDGLMIELERRPLDVVLEMAGYLEDLENIPWHPRGHVKFQLRGIECQ
jgi:hypothetical protein